MFRRHALFGSVAAALRGAKALAAQPSKAVKSVRAAAIGLPGFLNHKQETSAVKLIQVLAILAVAAAVGAANGAAHAAARAPAPASGEPQPANGRKIFTTCAYCHGLTGKGGPVGPSLQEVVGRPAGSLKGFDYSDAMKASGLIWTEANLSQFLANPDAKVKGTRMVFPGLTSKADVRDVIAYLRQIK